MPPPSSSTEKCETCKECFARAVRGPLRVPERTFSSGSMWVIAHCARMTAQRWNGMYRLSSKEENSEPAAFHNVIVRWCGGMIVVIMVIMIIAVIIVIMVVIVKSCFVTIDCLCLSNQHMICLYGLYDIHRYIYVYIRLHYITLYYKRNYHKLFHKICFIILCFIIIFFTYIRLYWFMFYCFLFCYILVHYI